MALGGGNCTGSAMKARKRMEERRRQEVRRRKDAAAAAVAKGRLGRAAELLTWLASECPEDPQFLVRLGEVQRRRGREAEAITAFLRAAARLTRSGHLLRAIAAYRLVLEIAPGHEGAHALLADLHERRLGRAHQPHRPALPTIAPPGPTGPVSLGPEGGRTWQAAEAVPDTDPAFVHTIGERPPGEAQAIARIALVREARLPGDDAGPMATRKAANDAGHSAGPSTPAPEPTPPVPVHRFSPPPPPPDPVQLGDLLDAFDLGEETPGPGPQLPPIPLFADLDPSTFQRLILRSRRRLLGPGDRAVSEGEAGDSFFVVVRGSLEVVRAEDTPATRLGTVEEGDFFGEMALLAGSPRTATVWATEESELLQFEGRELRALVRQHPQVASALRRFYRQRLLSNVLATSPFFNRIDRDASEALIARFRMREVAQGEELVQEGRPVDGLFVALHGRFEVVRGGGAHVAWLGAGELFGERSLLFGCPAGATCVARARGMVLRLPRESFDDVMALHPGLRSYLEQLDRERQLAVG